MDRILILVHVIYGFQEQKKFVKNYNLRPILVHVSCIHIDIQFHIENSKLSSRFFDQSHVYEIYKVIYQ
jgi:hypothetical protein